MRTATAEAWADTLAREINERRRAECMARIQRDAVQLAIDLLVREPDIAGFFRVFIKTLVEECESHACGVWLLNEPEPGRPRPCPRATSGWPRSKTASSPAAAASGTRWRCRARACPRTSWRYRPGWTEIVAVHGDDARLPEPVRAFNAANGIESLLVAPLVLPTRNLGWFALSCGRVPLCDGGAWHRALARRDGAPGDARAPSKPARRAEQVRSAPAGRARRAQPPRARHPRHAGAGLRRHPDAAAGRAAIRGGAAAGRRAQPRDRRRSRAHAHGRSAPVGLRAAPAGAGRGRRRRARAAGRARAARHRRPDRAHASSTCRRSRAASIARSSASRRKR